LLSQLAIVQGCYGESSRANHARTGMVPTGRPKEMDSATLTAPAKQSVRADSRECHQLFITHCLYGEGLFRQAGFTVRASSTRDPLWVRFALEYPPFRLPPGRRQTGAASCAVPRRLAFVRIPGGSSAVIHSVSLPDDSRGRPNNFFSHVLISPQL